MAPRHPRHAHSRTRRSNGRTRRKPRSRLLRWVGGGLGLALLALAGYLVYLDHRITSTFEGRRWSVPAQVFAQPLVLHAGRALGPADLVGELQRLGYRRRARPQAPGTYRRQGERIEAVLRAFKFSDGARPSRHLAISFADDRITALRTLAGERVDLVRLSPARIGSIFPNHGEDRLIVPPGGAPERLVETLKVVEDRHFESHRGFDPVAIARALWANLRAGRIVQGGSTLTQQLVKSYFLDNRQTLGRKLVELAMAIVLEVRYDKAELMNAYINEIYLGQDGQRAIHGFGLGSEFYFGKPLDALSPAQIALLVAVIRGPSYYDPYQHPERARARRDRVLAQMHAFELIDRATFESAAASDLSLARGAGRGGRYYPAFMDLVRQHLARDYDRDRLSSRGFRIFTTLDPRAQDAAERAARQTLQRLEKRRDLPAGALQTAIVVSNTQTGEVTAVVGGREPGSTGFNRALGARRPIGSLIKPAIYLTALAEDDYHLATRIEDAAVEVTDARGEIWRPSNFEGETHGRVPLARALAESMNLATVNLGLALGVDHVAERVGGLLGRSPPAAYPSLLLGALELTPLEVGELYGVFASGGFSAPSKAVTAVENPAGERLDRFPIAIEQVASGPAVMQLQHALRLVMARGTGKTSRHAARGVAGKTGTSDGFRDSWFAGFDAQHLAVIWVGYDDNRPTGLTGATGALPIWDALMSELGVRPLELHAMAGFAMRRIDFESGGRAETECGDPVELPIPEQARLPRAQGCGFRLRNIGDRVRRWLN